MLVSNSVAALCDRCCWAVASASSASALACSASMVAGCASRAAADFSARLSLSLAAASSTGANSGAPDCSARCTDALASAIFSFGIGVLAHAAKLKIATAQTVAPFIDIEIFTNTSVLLLILRNVWRTTLEESDKQPHRIGDARLPVAPAS